MRWGFFDWIEVFEGTIRKKYAGYFAAIPTPPDSEVEHVEGGLRLGRNDSPIRQRRFRGEYPGNFPVGIPDLFNPAVACPTNASLSLASEIVIGVRRRLTRRLPK